MRPWLFGLAVAGVATTGCITEPTFDRPAPQLPPDTNRPDVTTSIDVVPSTLRSGETATITLSVTNPTRRQVVLCFPSSCQLVYEAHDSGGQRVSDVSVCLAVPTALTLNPGETQRRELTWRASRDVYPPPQTVPLAPGEYRFQAYLDRIEDLRESAPFVVTVIP